jgi:hypothetical protein
LPFKKSNYDAVMEDANETEDEIVSESIGNLTLRQLDDI